MTRLVSLVRTFSCAFLVAAVLFMCGTAAAQDDVRKDRPLIQKHAWQWSEDERLAARFDAASMRLRTAAYTAEHGRIPVGSLSAQGASVAGDDRDRLEYVIEGRKNPELLLPHELFDSLVGGVDPRAEVRFRARAALNGPIAALNLDPEQFWKEMDAAAGEYAKRRLIAGDGDGNSHHREMCAMRFASLRAASAAIGDENLRRVLYDVVAPQTTFSASTNERDPIGKLRVEARGCK